jgi:hypothetical protein
MSEIEFDGEAIYAEAIEDGWNPYGFPVVSFASKDSQFYMIEGHHPPIARIIATFNWVVRHGGIFFLTDRRPDSFLEWGYVKYFKDEEDNYRFELTPGGAIDGYPVTFFEV